jgi:branched-chain amino acid aminotransferase
VTRDSVIQLLRDWGIAVEERPLTVEEILEANRRGQLQEMFGTGTGAVISPVGKLGFRGEAITIGDGESGQLSQRLFVALRDIQRGTAPDKHEWLHKVV